MQSLTSLSDMLNPIQFCFYTASAPAEPFLGRDGHLPQIVWEEGRRTGQKDNLLFPIHKHFQPDIRMPLYTFVANSGFSILRNDTLTYGLKE